MVCIRYFKMGGNVSTKSETIKNDGIIDSDLHDIRTFSDEEKHVIRSTWKVLSSQTDTLATDIFLRIFELRPEIKDFFPFRTATGDALVQHPYFRGHSMRFINAVSMTVLNLGAWEVILIPSLHQLGNHHTRIPGFTTDMFEGFYHAMNDVWSRHLGRSYNTTTRKIWCKIFRFLIDQVKVGYFEGLSTPTRNKTQDNTPRESLQVKANTTQQVDTNDTTSKGT
jgi:hypothetical protein